jgi:uroporphyrinogen-III synthase
MRLVVTRPEPDAERKAETLRGSGHDVLVEPLLWIEYRDVGRLPLEGVQALAVTSRNALRALARNEALARAKRLPLFAVGEATAAMAVALGFETVHEGSGTAGALASLIAEKCRPEAGSIMHLAGERLAGDLKGDLETLGFTAIQPRVYRTVPAPTLSGALRDALARGDIDGVILMSPLTAQTWSALTRDAGLGGEAAKLLHFCLSPAVAEGLAGLDPAQVLVAAAPREDELLALIAREAAH